MSMELQNMCRTCMLNESKQDETFAMISMVSIFTVPEDSKEELSLMELLKTTAPELRIRNNDKLPRIVCLECSNKIKEFYRFQKNCLNVEQKYYKMLEKQDPFDDSEAILRTKFPFDNENCLQSDESLPDDNKVESAIDDFSNDFDWDRSDSDWEEENKPSKNQSSTKLSPKKSTADFEINSTNLNLKQTNSEKRKDISEIEMPFQNDDGSISCVECEAILENVTRWQEHMREHRLGKIPKTKNNEKPKKLKKRKYKCQDCDKGFNRLIDFKNHERIHTDDQHFVCTECGKSFKMLSKLNTHMVRHHCHFQNDDGTISCQECEAILENVTQWQEHMRDHRLGKLQQKTYKCEHCDKEFKNLTRFKRHERIHTGEHKFLCIECGRSFKTSSHFKIHMLRHKGIKDIQCPHCPKKFVCSSGLYNHMLVHTNKRPFVCDTCGKGFHMAHMLKKHNLIHSNIRNFPCEYCDMRFYTAAKQRLHTRTHTGEKPYCCKYCDRAFAQSGDHVKHLRKHLGDKVYMCELCPLRFSLVRDLRIHFASHKDDDEETRTRNLEARTEAEKNLIIKHGLAEV